MSELSLVFVAALSVIVAADSVFGDGPVARVGSIWVANVLMFGIIYWGLRLRQQDWSHFGLSFCHFTLRCAIRVVVKSALVFVAAVAAFMVGAVLMANIVGMPERADMSRYQYLHGNLPMTLLALASVYIVSSFAEEVIYRGFLINRLAELGRGSTSAWWLAVCVSSIIFGLVHSDWGMVGMVQATCMGFALGISYLCVGRNLWVTILAHGYMDTILILQMYLGSG